MAIIKFNINDHEVTVNNPKLVLAQDSNNYDVCEFTFDNNWYGYSKDVIFYQNIQNVISVPLIGNQCEIPSEALKYNKKPLYIGVRGKKEDSYIATTRMVSFFVDNGAIEGGQYEEVEVTVSDFDKLMAAVDKKIDKNLGIENAGKYLKVGSDGYAELVEEYNGDSKQVNENTDAINKLKEEKADKSGWEANMYLGTDRNGNIVTKSEPNNGSNVTKTSQLINDSGFITKDTSDLTNYYSKNETDTLVGKKINNSGWNPNKFLGTDPNGNVIEKDAPIGQDVILDDTLNENSTNGIQNQAVTKAVDELSESIRSINIPDSLPNPKALSITVNGMTEVYDGSEAKSVNIDVGSGSSYVEIDESLTVSGKAADAKIVGNKFTSMGKAISSKAESSDIPTELPNPNALTITINGVSYVYDGSEVKSINIGSGISNVEGDIPTSLPNPYKLIFTGEENKEYDGSKEVIVDLSAIDKIGKMSIFAGDYIVDGVLDMSNVPITSNSVICFFPGVYTVKGCAISNLKNVTFEARGAVLNLQDYFIEVTTCENVSIFGGTYDKALEIAIKAVNTPHFRVKGARVTNVGSSSVENTSGIQLLGSCDNFEIDNCYVDGVSSGVISSDGYIHAYGIMINRMSSSNKYTKVGVVRQCTITNVSGIDSGSTKADGDGIFIQSPPYTDDNGNVEWRKDVHILIDNCVINGCKKRAIKSASVGVIVKDSFIDGAFWYAGIDAQYGHMIIDNTYVNNTSDYNNSITSAIISNEGGLIVRNCTVKAPYGESSYHPGIRFNKRLPASIVPDTTPWDNIYIDNCFFDKVSIPVYGYVSGETSPVPIKGLYVDNCRVGDFNNGYVVSMSNTLFSSMETFSFTDWRLDYGSNRTDVKAVNSNFAYPVSINLDPSIAFELHSKHWTDEPMSGYSGLPTSPHSKIIYAGSNMGNIAYKEYTGHGSRIYGNKAPSEITSTLSKQLLYNSRIGDIYTNTVTGDMYVCTVAGTSSSIGTWSALSDKTYIDAQILGGAS